jgi:hypothetical protein
VGAAEGGDAARGRLDFGSLASMITVISHWDEARPGGRAQPHRRHMAASQAELGTVGPSASRSTLDGVAAPSRGLRRGDLLRLRLRCLRAVGGEETRVHVEPATIVHLLPNAHTCAPVMRGSTLARASLVRARRDLAPRRASRGWATPGRPSARRIPVDARGRRAPRGRGLSPRPANIVNVVDVEAFRGDGCSSKVAISAGPRARYERDSTRRRARQAHESAAATRRRKRS